MNFQIAQSNGQSPSVRGRIGSRAGGAVPLGSCTISLPFVAILQGDLMVETALPEDQEFME